MVLSSTCARPVIGHEHVEARDEDSSELALERAEDAWERLQRAVPDDPQITPDDPFDYWGEVRRTMSPDFRVFIEEPHLAEKVRFFVEQFGAHGPQVDLRWMIAARTFGGEAPDFGEGPVAAKNDKIGRRFQLTISEIEVRRFLKHPELLQRYYHAVAWYEAFVRPDDLPRLMDQTNKRFKDFPDEEYWWYARNFLLFAHATGRDDLLEDADPEDLKPRFDKWWEWFGECGMYLRPSANAPVWYLDQDAERQGIAYQPFIALHELPPLEAKPDHPFPNWEGPPPPLAEQLRQVE